MTVKIDVHEPAPVVQPPVTYTITMDEDEFEVLRALVMSADYSNTNSESMWTAFAQVRTNRYVVTGFDKGENLVLIGKS
jgi:hypothetical protein